MTDKIKHLRSWGLQITNWLMSIDIDEHKTNLFTPNEIIHIRDARPAPWGGEKVCPTHPAKRRLCPAPPCENYQNLRGAAGQSWFQSVEIRKAITRKDPILSDKYLPHSQISWFSRFFALPRPAPQTFTLAPPHAQWPMSSAPCIPGPYMYYLT